MRKEYSAQCPPVLKDFLGYTEVIKGRSENTINEYFIDLRTFFRYIKQLRGLSSPSADPEDIPIADVSLELIRTITTTDIYEYMSYLRNDRDNSNKTRARKTTSLRVFFKYLTDYRHDLEHNPAQNLETPKQKKTLPKYLTLEQSLSLMTLPKGPYAQRDYCMLTLLLNCGLRRAELAGINLSDIKTDHTLIVRGKGNKERQLFLNESCQYAISEYLKVRPVDGVVDKNALFLSRLKKRISLQGVHLIVKGYLKQVPGAEEMSTHKLRHTAATLMYQQGGVDIRVLKDILGHENLGTTEIYTHISDKQIRRAAEQNPLAHIKVKKKAETE